MSNLRGYKPTYHESERPLKSVEFLSSGGLNVSVDKSIYNEEDAIQLGIGSSMGTFTKDDLGDLIKVLKNFHSQM